MPTLPLPLPSPHGNRGIDTGGITLPIPTYNNPAGLLAGAYPPPPAGLMVPEATYDLPTSGVYGDTGYPGPYGPNNAGFYAETLERLAPAVQAGLMANAAPVPKPMSPAINAMPKPKPAMPSLPAGEALNQAVRAMFNKQAGPAQPGGPAAAGGQEMGNLALLNQLIRQQVPGGLGSRMQAHAASNATLANMIASRGRHQFVDAGTIMRGRRQESIENLQTLLTFEREVGEALTAADRLNLEKLKFGAERGDARAAAFIKGVELFKDLGKDVLDLSTRGTRFWEKSARWVENNPGASPQQIYAAVSTFAVEEMKGAKAVKRPLLEQHIGDKAPIKFAETLAKEEAGTASGVMAAGDAASYRQGAISQMLSYASDPTFRSGKIDNIIFNLELWGRDIGLNINGLLSKLGIERGDLDKTAEFNRLSKELAVEALRNFKGSTSNKELTFAQETVPNLFSQEGGNIRALVTMQELDRISIANVAELRRRLSEVGAEDEQRVFREWQRWVNSDQEGKLEAFKQRIEARAAEINASRGGQGEAAGGGEQRTLPDGTKYTVVPDLSGG